MNATAAFLASVITALGFGTSTTPAIVPTAQCATITRTLSLGSEHPEVKRLQNYLGVNPTGYFGSITRQKLISWQISKGVISSTKTLGAGTTGPKTRAVMKCPAHKMLSAPISAPVKTIEKATTTATTTSPAVSVPIVPMPSQAGGGGGGTAAQCVPTGPMPSQACTTGQWEKIEDEASCLVWYCSEPTSDQG